MRLGHTSCVCHFVRFRFRFRLAERVDAGAELEHSHTILLARLRSSKQKCQQYEMQSVTSRHRRRGREQASENGGKWQHIVDSASWDVVLDGFDVLPRADASQRRSCQTVVK